MNVKNLVFVAKHNSGGGISERFQWNLSIPLLSYLADEMLENVVSKMKYASLVIARVKVAAKEEVKRPLEHVCIPWNTKEEGCHWWMVKKDR